MTFGTVGVPKFPATNWTAEVKKSLSKLSPATIWTVRQFGLSHPLLMPIFLKAYYQQQRCISIKEHHGATHAHYIQILNVITFFIETKV